MDNRLGIQFVFPSLPFWHALAVAALALEQNKLSHANAHIVYICSVDYLKGKQIVEKQ